MSVLFVLMLYIPVSNFLSSWGISWVTFPVLNQYFAVDKGLAQEHNTVPPLRPEPATPQSRVEQPSTKSLCSSVSDD